MDQSKAGGKQVSKKYEGDGWLTTNELAYMFTTPAPPAPEQPERREAHKDQRGRAHVPMDQSKAGGKQVSTQYEGVCSICRERSHRGEDLYPRRYRLGWIWGWSDRVGDVLFAIVHDGDCFTQQERRILTALAREDVLIKSRNTPELEDSE
jgi:hypothetical protein